MNTATSIEELENLDTRALKPFTFKGMNVFAKCVANYDADTVTLVFKYKDEYIKLNCRILGIDAPELRSTNIKLKKLAYSAKEYLSTLILNKVVAVSMLDFDKYGRVLVNIKTLDTNHDIKDIMVSGGYAMHYNGATKLTETQQLIAYKLV